MIGGISLLSGITASMGLGGGFILLIYLTAFAGVPQMEAQWMNLVFFLPIGGLSLFLHWKNGLLEKQVVLPAVLCGVVVAAGGCLLAQYIGNDWLRKGFAIFLLFIGLREIFSKTKESKTPAPPSRHKNRN